MENTYKEIAKAFRNVSSGCFLIASLIFILLFFAFFGTGFSLGTIILLCAFGVFFLLAIIFFVRGKVFSDLAKQHEERMREETNWSFKKSQVELALFEKNQKLAKGQIYRYMSYATDSITSLLKIVDNLNEWSILKEEHDHILQCLTRDFPSFNDCYNFYYVINKQTEKNISEDYRNLLASGCSCCWIAMAWYCSYIDIAPKDLMCRVSGLKDIRPPTEAKLPF